MEFLVLNFFLTAFSLIKIPGYLDPGGLSPMIAMIASAFVGAIFAIRLYWYKIKHKISRNWISNKKLINRNLLDLKLWSLILGSGMNGKN